MIRLVSRPGEQNIAYVQSRIAVSERLYGGTVLTVDRKQFTVDAQPCLLEILDTGEVVARSAHSVLTTSRGGAVHLAQ